MGLSLCAVSLFVHNIIAGTALGITAFCCLWSIKELFQQRKRVDRGWFPQKQMAPGATSDALRQNSLKIFKIFSPRHNKIPGLRPYKG
ncbi:MAG: DUF4491 family protein [Treponema sp.]|nr:DUF4491 family protein [Treponema sp.]